MSDFSLRFPLAIALVALAGPLSAAAQDLRITPTLLSGGGRSLANANDIQIRGINIADCNDPEAFVELEVTIGTTTSFPGVIDLWHDGGQSSVACQEANPGRLMDGNMRQCVHIPLSSRTVNMNRRIRIPISELAAGDPAKPSNNGSDICTTQRASYTLYFFASDASPFIGPADGISWGRVTIPIDGVAPQAPEITSGTNLSGTRVSISWRGVADGPDQVALMRYQVRRIGDCDADPSATASPIPTDPMDGGEEEEEATPTPDPEPDPDPDPDEEAEPSESELLSPDDDLDEGVGSRSSAMTITTSAGATSATVDVSGTAEGTQVGFVVEAIDRAQNVGRPSEVICVTHVPSVGFCDVAEGGCPSGCAAGGRHAPFALPFLAALVVILRRRFA